MSAAGQGQDRAPRARSAAWRVTKELSGVGTEADGRTLVATSTGRRGRAGGAVMAGLWQEGRGRRDTAEQERRA